MIAIVVDSAATVDRIYEVAMMMGAVDEGEPGLREINIPGFYGCYFRDLDQNKLAVYHIVEPDGSEYKTLKKLY